MIPAFMLFRDRVTYGQRCLAHLQAAGLDVRIIDLGTTWEPALDWLADQRAILETGPKFGHPYDLWRSGLIFDLISPDVPYIVTDCDVIPGADVPKDWPARMVAELDEHPDIVKAGMSLDLDMPHWTRGRSRIISWEGQYWILTKPCGAYIAQTDTTLAAYRPLRQSQTEGHFRTFPGVTPAVRLPKPYLAQHLPWFEPDPDSDELAWYRHHIEEGVTHWTRQDLPS